MLRGKNNLESNKYHKEPSPCVQNEMLQCENSDKHRVNADKKINIASVEETSLIAQTDYKIGVFHVFFAPPREFDRSLIMSENWMRIKSLFNLRGNKSELNLKLSN